MRNIPAFACEFGVASLILQEIPSQRAAYCTVQWAQQGKLPALLAQCGAFCRAAGAETVYADRPPVPGQAPAIVLRRMTGQKSEIPASQDDLVRLDAENWPQFLALYRQAMAQVSGAASLRPADLPRLLQSGGCYLVQRQGRLLGIGQVSGNQLLSIAAAERGMGLAVAASLLSQCPGPELTLTVAEGNGRAIALYRKLGFQPAEIETQYWILERNDHGTTGLSQGD